VRVWDGGRPGGVAGAEGVDGAGVDPEVVVVEGDDRDARAGGDVGDGVGVD
jgi:hypothetical protein